MLTTVSAKLRSQADRPENMHHWVALRGWDLIKAWALPVLLALVALVFDAADRRVPFSVLASGALDECAHLATGALGLLALSCFIDVPRRFYVAGLIASVAIDLDHVPMYLGMGNPYERPVTHSLATVAVVVVAAAASRRHRAVLAGAATGLLIHFARDIAEGPPGVRMLWPLSRHGMDGQCPVVPSHDRRVHGRATDPGNPRHPPHAYPPVSGARASRVLRRAGRAGRPGPVGGPGPVPASERLISRTDRTGCPPAATGQFLKQVKSSAPTGRREEAWRDLGDGLDPHDLGVARAAARLAGGYPPNPGPELAALAPLADVPAVAAVIVAAYAAWWLAALLAIPAALLVIWQLPPAKAGS